MAKLNARQLKEGQLTLQYQNIKLESEIDNLIDKINKLEKDHNVQILKAELEEFKKNSMSEIEFLRESILNRDKVLAHNKMLLGIKFYPYKKIYSKTQFFPLR
jgi:hypothetical protein